MAPVYSTSLILSQWWRDIWAEWNQMRWKTRLCANGSFKVTIELRGVGRPVTWITQLRKIGPHPIFPISLKWDWVRSNSNQPFSLSQENLKLVAREKKTISTCHQADSKWIFRPGDQGCVSQGRRGGMSRGGRVEGGEGPQGKSIFRLTRSWLAASLWGFALRFISGLTFNRIWLDLNEQL